MKPDSLAGPTFLSLGVWRGAGVGVLSISSEYRFKLNQTKFKIQGRVLTPTGSWPRFTHVCQPCSPEWDMLMHILVFSP